MSPCTRLIVMLAGGVVVGIACATGGVVSATATSAGELPHPELLAIEPAYGDPDGGAVVTVHGTGFVEGDTTVEVDHVNLDADVRSSTELSFVTPPHAPGSATVVVVVSELVSAGRYYVYEPAVPVQIESPTATPSAAAPRPGRTPSSRAPEPEPTPTGAVPTPGSPAPLRPDLPPTLAATGGRSWASGGWGLALVLAGLVLVRAATPRRPRRTR